MGPDGDVWFDLLPVWVEILTVMVLKPKCSDDTTSITMLIMTHSFPLQVVSGKRTVGPDKSALVIRE